MTNFTHADTHEATLHKDGNNFASTSQFWRDATKKQQELFAQGKKVSYIFIDLENFRFINMKGDIEEGARLVNLLSDLIHEEFPDALIIRGASIQFIVLTGVDDVTKRLQYIHNEAKEVRPEYNIIVKAGVYVAKDEHILPITACDYAKAACANIKSDVHSIYQIYDDELNQSLTIRNYVISHFNMALKNHDIKVYYQPIIRSLTQKACGAEALARWENPTYGTLIPGSFISALEDMHLIPDFDLYIAEEVCRDYSRLKRANGVYMPISVNFSRIDFEMYHIREELDRIRHKYHVPKEYLIVEITERAFSNTIDILKEQVQDLRSHGYQVWMDDFGSGFSSLSLLKDLRFDLIKFDLRFLLGTENKERGEFILGALINMVKELGMKTLVEGVEEESQVRFLQSIGCERYQGYYYSKPVTIDTLLTQKFWDSNETKECQHYYDAVGHCNMIQAVPYFFYKNWKNNRALPFFPAAIFEYETHRGITLREINLSFLSYIGQTNFESIEECRAYFRQTPRPILYNAVCIGIQRCLKTHDRTRVETVNHDTYCTLSIEPIAHNEETGVEAFLVVVTNVSAMSINEHYKSVQQLINSVFSIFSKVDVLNLTKQTVQNVLSHHVEDVQYEGKTLTQIIQEWSTCVAGQDKERFFAFYDLHTLLTRICQKPDGYLIHIFQCVDEATGEEYVEVHLLWHDALEDDVTIHRGVIRLSTDDIPATLRN